MSSIYVHIPFCVKKCPYCAFVSDDGFDDDELDFEYQRVKTDMLYASRLRPVAETVYFGGGTPPVIGISRLTGLIQYAKEVFEIPEGAEITCEVNPKTVNYEFLKQMKDSGFNRLSVGVQSLNDESLRILGRIHDAKDAVKVFWEGRKAGFDNISCDLMFALPDQTVEMVEADVRKMLELRPDHISLYPLSIEHGTFFYAANVQKADENTEYAMYKLICHMLKEAGYIHYEVSNYCLPGKESRHNINYWKGGEYIGCGHGSHSYAAGYRFNYTGYMEQITEENAKEEKIMLGLRLAEGIDADEQTAKKIKKYIDAGYAEYTDGRLKLTEDGFWISNAIIGDILA
ncbi:MAG: radical SAM family heme chaperone HemW [Clostridia bacterium]|nr:radical SAM family heme chaperone HemW [Clostridia bacterium]